MSHATILWGIIHHYSTEISTEQERVSGVVLVAAVASQKHGIGGAVVGVGASCG